MYSIPLSVPSLKGKEWKYVKECIDTEWVSSGGKYVGLFEQKIAEYTGSKYAIACMNGTAAIQVSLQRNYQYCIRTGQIFFVQVSRARTGA